jgi:hypothetical protein
MKLLYILSAIVTIFSRCTANIYDGATLNTNKACQLYKQYINTTDIGTAGAAYIDSGSALYNNSAQAYWYFVSFLYGRCSDIIPRSSKCWQHASCILSLGSIADVVRIVDIIASTKATFSSRSGGHDCNKGHSSVNQSGLIIDMAGFNFVSVAAAKQSVQVGVGDRWGAVYDTLRGTGVSVNGAKSPNPGVGGQTLGGGVGWFINYTGVTAASVIAAEVFLANSTVVKASENSNKELLWALK